MELEDEDEAADDNGEENNDGEVCPDFKGGLYLIFQLC